MRRDWILSHKTCPRCDRQYDAGLSGVVSDGTFPTTVSLANITDLCITENDGDTVLYFHPEAAEDDT